MKSAHAQKLEEMLAFAIERSLDASKKDKENFSLKVDELLQNEYQISREFAARLNAPVYWYLALESRLIPTSGGSQWEITERAKSLGHQDFEKISKKLLKRYKAYFEANIARYGFMNGKN